MALLLVQKKKMVIVCNRSPIPQKDLVFFLEPAMLAHILDQKSLCLEEKATSFQKAHKMGLCIHACQLVNRHRSTILQHNKCHVRVESEPSCNTLKKAGAGISSLPQNCNKPSLLCDALCECPNYWQLQLHFLFRLCHLHLGYFCLRRPVWAAVTWPQRGDTYSKFLLGRGHSNKKQGIRSADDDHSAMLKSGGIYRQQWHVLCLLIEPSRRCEVKRKEAGHRSTRLGTVSWIVWPRTCSGN